MNIQEQFKRWLCLATEDDAVAEELRSLAEKNDAAGIEDRFYRELEFGTGGLRGVLGAGSNRMNIYTVRKATQGLADYLSKQTECAAVAIAHDSRINSQRFARETAAVLAGNGIEVYLYPELMPTPALSFAVRRFGCTAGVCVTASHNPAKYNGYKVYGSDGCQITLNAAQEILSEISKVDTFDGVRRIPFEEGVNKNLIHWIGAADVQAFLDAVWAQRVGEEDCQSLSVVYTPLNGAGRYCVTEILKRLHIGNVTLVPEQENPDGNFPTCPYPNPEIREALQKGLALCETVKPDLLLATDPDCDRVGIAVRHQGKYVLLSGNEVGVLLLDYIIKTREKNGTMPKNPVVVKTIVTTDMAQEIAEKHGIQMRNMLTGFKFIGEQIGRLESDGESGRYLFGFEESYGYLSGTHVRDKDAVNASMLICQMAGAYKKEGKTLYEALEELYQEYGTYQNRLLTFTFEGAAGMRRMNEIMDTLRRTPKEEIGGLAVARVNDYLSPDSMDPGKNAGIRLPKSNVLEYLLQGGAKLIIRPSGTEPKIKIYVSCKAPSLNEAKRLCDKLETASKALFE